MGELIAPRCRHCGSKHVKLRKQIAANGHEQIGWRCLDCDRWALTGTENNRPFVKHDLLMACFVSKPYGIEDIPIIADHSDWQPCVICGAPGEYHHWAPQAFAEAFGPDWGAYPHAYLCRKHHMLWHRIVTPGLVPEAEGIKYEHAS